MAVDFVLQVQACIQTILTLKLPQIFPPQEKMLLDVQQRLSENLIELGLEEKGQIGHVHGIVLMESVPPECSC